MPDEHPLPDTFRTTAYRVRRLSGGHAVIRIDQPLPAELHALLPHADAPWGFITAWNPGAEPRSRAANRKAQRALRDALLEHVAREQIHAAAGVHGDWREPSLFVTGIDFAPLDRLMHEFGQLAIVRGCGHGSAELCWAHATRIATRSRMDSPPSHWDNHAIQSVVAMNPTTSPPALLEARGLSFLRQDEPVFGPLDFALAPGAVALVEGDNGSGKTTLMRVIAGLLHADAGSLWFDGQPMDRDRMRGRMLFLAHHLGLKFDLSPLENLRVAAGLYGCREGTTPDGVLLDVGLAGYEHEPVRQLSAGQKKRAALARLLLVPADLWLLDEPFANLDREGIALVNRLIEQHAAAGGAALVTSHGAVTFLHGQPQHIRLST